MPQIPTNASPVSVITGLQSDRISSANVLIADHVNDKGHRLLLVYIATPVNSEKGRIYHVSQQQTGFRTPCSR